jgi:hypothetical protein
MRHCWLALVAGLCLVFLPGCGNNGRMNIKGQVLKGGSAFVVPEDDFVRVTLVPVVEEGRTFTGFFASYDNKTGTFTALGPDLTGVPRGKYRVVISHERNRKDLFEGQYDFERTPFVFDINSASQRIVIDLDKPSS